MVDEIILKECKRCHIKKQTTEFAKDTSRKDGLQRWCKYCRAEYYAENKDYSRQYYVENKEKIDTYRLQWQCANKEKVSSYRRKCYEKNKQYFANCSREYYIKNKEKITESKRKYYRKHSVKILLQQKEWHRRNPEYSASRASYSEQYRKENKDKIYIGNSNYRAQKRRSSGTHTKDQTLSQWIIQEGICFWCDYPLLNPFTKDGFGRKPHLDHVVPLKRGGSNSIENLVWSCCDCNLSKGSKLPSEWKGNNGRWIEN